MKELTEDYNLNSDPRFAAVITTINSPNDGMQQLLEFGTLVGAPVIVVGDTKTPDTWGETAFEFLSVAKQREIFPDFADIVPTRHYARKNLGYLRARMQNVEWIYETDDDNVPTESPFGPRDLNVEAQTFASDSRWLNVYETFGYSSENEKPVLIWPRGFDLRSLKGISSPGNSQIVQSPVQQGLANGDPDVDAIYRLVLGNFVSFNLGEPIALTQGQICPTNSQTTWWHSSIHQLMYLPSTCTFRLTDILRGFVAWRILQERNETVTFHSPIVRQDRNEHDLLRDFKDETELYIYSDEIIDGLSKLSLNGKDFSQQLEICYEFFIQLKLVSEDELRILAGWNSYF